MIIFMKKKSSGIGLPTLATAVVTDGTTDATLDTGNFTPAVGTFLAVATVSRDGAAHDPGHSLSATGFTCTFTQRAIITAADGVADITTAWFTGIVSASAEGYITLTTSESVFQKAIIPLVVPRATTFNTKGDDQNTTGTTLNVAYEATPNTGALSLGCVAQNSSTGTPTLDGHNDITGADGAVSALKWIVKAKLGTPPSTLAFENLASGVGHAGAGITLL